MEENYTLLTFEFSSFGDFLNRLEIKTGLVCVYYPDSVSSRPEVKTVFEISYKDGVCQVVNDKLESLCIKMLEPLGAKRTWLNQWVINDSSLLKSIAFQLKTANAIFTGASFVINSPSGKKYYHIKEVKDPLLSSFLHSE